MSRYMKMSVLLFFVILGCDKKEKYFQDNNLEKTKNIWFSENKTPEVYSKSAYEILNYTKINNAVELTFGNVIKVLGSPTRFNCIDYVFDENDNIIGEESRTEVFYEDKKIMISFSARGFVDGVFWQIRPEEMTGTDNPDWQIRSNKEETQTIVAGILADYPKIALEISELSYSLIEKNVKERDWYEFITDEVDVTDEEYNFPCKAKCSIIDGIANNLVRAHYVIEGKHLLYCDVWYQQIEGSWSIISADTAKEIFITSQSL